MRDAGHKSMNDIWNLRVESGATCVDTELAVEGSVERLQADTFERWRLAELRARYNEIRPYIVYVVIVKLNPRNVKDHLVINTVDVHNLILIVVIMPSCDAVPTL